MTTSTHLLRRRRFLPLFVTQLLGAFNDNLFKNAVVFFVVYTVYQSEKAEAVFSGIASALFILPFFLLSALAGQLADMRDKAMIIRYIKLLEIAIMVVGGGGLVLAWQGIGVQHFAIPLMLLALLGMGVHSTFFGPIKYAILPQHLHADEVLAGTGLVEAGTYLAILAGTILAGFIPPEWAAAGVVVTALLGYVSSRSIPSAPPQGVVDKLDYNILRASIRLVKNTMHDRRVFLAIASISFFWAVGAVLFVEFPLLAKRVLCASFTPTPDGHLMSIAEFLHHPLAPWLLAALGGIAIAGGMFVVPLYAFLTTFVDKTQTARTIAANNVVNSGAMTLGALVAVGLGSKGVAIVDLILLAAVMCLISAWLGLILYRAEQAAA
jgi:MFS family permease